MSAETLSPTNGAEFRAARPTVETSRGTEVKSNTGNKIVDMANRVAAFMDRLKGRGTEVSETGQEMFDQGKAFLESTGKKAVTAAVETGKVVGGAALFTAEMGVGVAVLGTKAAERGVKAIANGMDRVDNWIDDKADLLGDAVDTGITAIKDKGTEVREAAVGKFEEVRGFFRSRAETAKQSMQKRRRYLLAGYSRTRRNVRNTVESGLTFAEETGENIKHNARVIRRTGKVAMAHYRANSVPVVPR